MLRGALQTAYLLAGAVVAYQHAYIGISDWKVATSMVAGILGWPLILMGFDLQLASV